MTIAGYYAVHNAHHHDWVSSAIVIFCVASVVVGLGLFVAKVQPETSRRDLASDFLMMVFIKFGLIGLVLFAKQVLEGSGLFGDATDSSPFDFEPLASALPLPPLAALALYIVVRDAGQWVKHVTVHKLPVLWSFHKVHHANTSLSIFADYRLHLVEVALGSFVTLGTLAITGYPVEYAFIAISLEETVGMFNHANLRLNYGPFFSRLITSPQNHRIHHSSERAHLDASGDAHNFAVLFPAWDILAGTYYSDIEDFPVRTGVEAEDELERGGLVSRQWIGLRDAGREMLRLLRPAANDARAAAAGERVR